MSDFDDFIPGPVNRPDCPEFFQVCEIVLGHDSRSKEEGESGRKKILTQFIPENVGEYMAFQRALPGILRILDLPEAGFLVLPMTSMDGLNALAMAMGSWVDGFCAGAAYQKKYGEKVSE